MYAVLEHRNAECFDVGRTLLLASNVYSSLGGSHEGLTCSASSRMFSVLRPLSKMHNALLLMMSRMLREAAMLSSPICKQSFGFIKLIVEAASRSKDAQDQLLRTYTKTLAGAPYLRELVKGGRKKSKELAGILDDVC